VTVKTNEKDYSGEGYNEKRRKAIISMENKAFRKNAFGTMGGKRVCPDSLG